MYKQTIQSIVGLIITLGIGAWLFRVAYLLIYRPQYPSIDHDVRPPDHPRPTAKDIFPIDRSQ